MKAFLLVQWICDKECTMAKRYTDFRQSNRPDEDIGKDNKTQQRLEEKRKNKRKQSQRRQRLKDKYDT
jgi:hypothetical protein